MYIIILTILGLGLRLFNIDKPEGLWNDEYVSWFVASTPIFKGFWQEVLKQCHMPLYYIYLKPFTIFSDNILRLTSVIPSILAIPTMYFVGKEFSKRDGYICAAITTFLPFLIYYSQEVRFYSLLFLLSALSLLFLVRIINNKNGWCGYIISSILIILTHVLGIIYVLLTLTYIAYKKKIINKKITIIGILLCLICIPFGINILKMLPSSQWWGVFSYTNILFLFSDYLSPILTNHINAPQVFYYSKNLLFITLITIPTIIGLIALLRGSYEHKGLALIILNTIIITAILAITEKLVFITKYTIEILPIIILLISLGLKKRCGIVFLSILLSFYIFSIFTPYYPSKKERLEGHKLACNVLNQEKPDKIIFTYYAPDRFLRYLETNAEMYHISKSNRFDYINNPEAILDNVKIGERVSLVFLNSVSFIPQKWIDIAQEKNLPEMFITFSIIKNKLIQEALNNYRPVNIRNRGSWTVITGTKVR